MWMSLWRLRQHRVTEGFTHPELSVFMSPLQCQEETSSWPLSKTQGTPLWLGGLSVPSTQTDDMILRA